MFGPSFLTEDDIPGSSPIGKDANRLKNSELKIEHVLVDPDVNFVYTRRKRRLLGLEDALDPKHQNSEYHSLPTGLRKAKAFLADE